MSHKLISTGALMLFLLASTSWSSNETEFSNKCEKLGNFLNSKGKHNLAVKVFKKCLLRSPEDPKSLSGLVWSQHLEGNMNASMASLRKLKSVCSTKKCPKGLVTDMNVLVSKLSIE